MRSIRFVVALSLTACLPPAVGAASASCVRPGGGAAPATAPRYRVLVFTKTAGYRHDSIPAATAALRELGARHGFAVDATEDAAAFADRSLAKYSAVVFLLTTGDVLAKRQQAAFERFIRAGNGYAGVHSASDTEYDWPWYGGLVGAYFRSHPAVQTAAVRVEDRQHPSTAMLPDPWVRRDEWYDFRANPRGRVRVLARLDEGTYGGGAMGDHPVAWYHAYDGGRAWYTAGGHTAESYSEAEFLAHLLGGIEYAATGAGGAAGERGGRSSRRIRHAPPRSSPAVPYLQGVRLKSPGFRTSRGTPAADPHICECHFDHVCGAER